MENQEQEYQEMVKEWIIDSSARSATHISGVKMTLIEKNEDQKCSVVAEYPKNWELSLRVKGQSPDEIEQELQNLKAQFSKIAQKFPLSRQLSPEEMIVAMKQRRLNNR